MRFGTRETSSTIRSGRTVPGFVAICIALMGILVALSLVFGTSDTAAAKTIADYDAEIAAQEKVVEEKEAVSAEAQAVLAQATSWYYKNISSGAVVDMIFNESGITEAIDKMSYMDKIYATYAQKKTDAEMARNEAIGAQEALEVLREEKKARAHSLANARNIQFPQGGGQAWSNIRYWGGTVATSGCGLCAYTVVIDALTGKDYTPVDMMGIRGDWKGMDGYPDDGTGVPGGESHHDFTLDTFEIETWNIDNSVEALKESLTERETAAIVCSRGQAFKDNSGSWRWSSGHFVAVVGYDENGFHVADSAYSREQGTDVVYSDSEMAKMLRGANLVTVYSN